jgi:hypothetical protein
LKEQPLKKAVLQAVGRKTAGASVKLARVLQEAQRSKHFFLSPSFACCC